MASRAEAGVVYVAGVAQGIALVTFPAASTILVDPSEYDLTHTQYGTLFLPQVITAIGAALLGAGLGGRFGTKRVYLVGLVAGLVAMSLLVASSMATGDRAVAYPVLLVATAFLGAGFGLTVPALNTLAAAFHPDRVDRSILVLNALLGLGTVLAPVFVAVFVGLGFWWGLPVTAAMMLAGLIAVSARLPLRASLPAAPRAAPARRRTAIPPRFWVYAGFAALYGVCETLNGNWAQVNMTDLDASTTLAAASLTAFWATVTAGRIFFAAIQRRLSARVTYHSLPFLLAAAFVLIALLPSDQPALGVLAFGLAGLGCSALLPLSISFGQEELVGFSTAVAGGVIAFYQLGYGIAAFGVGPLVSAGLGLSTAYALGAAVAALLGAWSFAVARRRPSPVTLHPRLGHAAR